MDIDYNYRKLLAENLSCPVENLNSIVGSNEFKKLLSRYTPENFYTGDFLSENFDELYKNILDKTFRINLHMHTVESDGIISVEELLNQAVSYAQRVKSKINDDLPAFVISITDHDSVEGTKKALKIIAQTPEKFKDIKFVAGIEFTARFDNENILIRPFTTDFMGYCINPFDADLSDFLQKITSSRIEEAKSIITTLNKLGFNLDFEEVQKSHHLIKIAGSVAFFDLIKRYIYKKYKHSQLLIINNDKIEALFFGKPPKFTSTVRELSDILKKSYGLMGIAHPGRMYLERIDESKVFASRERNFKQESLYLLMKDAVNQGAVLAESNYQYTMRHFDKEMYKLTDVAELVCEEFNLLRTGGTDGHRANIFTHTVDLSEEQLDLLLKG